LFVNGLAGELPVWKTDPSWWQTADRQLGRGLLGLHAKLFAHTYYNVGFQEHGVYN
jgi:hypothetical protein